MARTWFTQNEDELSVLYDILFDEEVPSGFKLFTVTHRVYRFTKQAFLNISYGQRSKSQLTAGPKLKKNAVPLPADWRKRDEQPSNAQIRQVTSPKRILPQNWRTEQPPTQPNQDANRSNTVSEFFSAYRAPASNKPVPRRRPEEQWRQQPLRPNSNVDAEFQNMWGQLQQKLATPVLMEQRGPPPPNVAAAYNPPHVVAEQTNALKKFLKINEGLPSSSMSQMGPPPGGPPTAQHVYSFSNPFTRVDTSTLQPTLAPDGRLYGQVNFPPPNTKPSVDAENLISGLLGLSNRPPGLPIPVARMAFPQNFNRPPLASGMVRGFGDVAPQNHRHQVRSPKKPYLLPNPPQQWYQPEDKLVVQHQDNQSPLAGKINSFVPPPTAPLHVPKIDSARQPLVAASQEPSTAPQPPRRGRIAAKFGSKPNK